MTFEELEVIFKIKMESLKDLSEQFYNVTNWEDNFYCDAFDQGDNGDTIIIIDFDSTGSNFHCTYV